MSGKSALPPSYSSITSGSSSRRGTTSGSSSRRSTTSGSIVKILKRITIKSSMDNLEGFASELGKFECYLWIIIIIIIIINN